jgi:hypothetical protein
VQSLVIIKTLCVKQLHGTRIILCIWYWRLRNDIRLCWLRYIALYSGKICMRRQKNAFFAATALKIIKKRFHSLYTVVDTDTFIFQWTVWKLHAFFFWNVGPEWYSSCKCVRSQTGHWMAHSTTDVSCSKYSQIVPRFMRPHKDYIFYLALSLICHTWWWC